MQTTTRKIVSASLAAALLVLVVLWWKSGFSLDFTRFFAAGPIATPIETCVPRPACLDAIRPCAIAEPSGGWCPPLGEIETPIPQSAEAVHCSPETQDVRVGHVVNLTASSGGGAYTWFAADASKPVIVGTSGGPGTFSFTFQTVGVKKVSVLSDRFLSPSNGNKVKMSTTDVAACTVNVNP